MAATPGPWIARGRDILTSDGKRFIALASEGNQALLAAAPALRDELRDVLEWALVERAPLRQQEIDSIRAALRQAGEDVP